MLWNKIKQNPSSGPVWRVPKIRLGLKNWLVAPPSVFKCRLEREDQLLRLFFLPFGLFLFCSSQKRDGQERDSQSVRSSETLIHSGSVTLKQTVGWYHRPSGRHLPSPDLWPPGGGTFHLRLLWGAEPLFRPRWAAVLRAAGATGVSSAVSAPRPTGPPPRHIKPFTHQTSGKKRQIVALKTLFPCRTVAPPTPSVETYKR